MIKFFVCIYKIVSENNNLNLESPFLSYLLYKYKNDKNVIFPFKYLKIIIPISLQNN